jgi:hypothetical protein
VQELPRDFHGTSVDPIVAAIRGALALQFDLSAQSIVIVRFGTYVAGALDLAGAFLILKQRGRLLRPAAVLDTDRELFRASATYLIVEIDEEILVEHCAPKIAGAWNLHRYFASRPLDFFVLFSSGSTLLGSPSTKCRRSSGRVRSR